MSHKILFLHGLESSSQAYKARYLRELYGGRVVAPDWRVSRLLADCKREIIDAVSLDRHESFIVVGSSMGGFMASICLPGFSAKCSGVIYINPVVNMTPWGLRYFDDANQFEFDLHDVPATFLLGSKDTVCDPNLTTHLFGSRARLVVVDDDHQFTQHYRRIAKEIDRIDAASSPCDKPDEKRDLWNHSRRVLIDGDQ